MKGFKVSRLVMVSLVVISLLALSGVAMARGHGGGMGGCGGGFAAMLTPEQQTKVQQITVEHFTATNEVRTQMLSKKAELQALMYNSNPDTAKIEAISKEIGVLEGKLMADRAQMQAKLTKEGIPMQGRMGMGGHGGMGGKGNRGYFNCNGQGMMMRGQTN